jgi:tetratricopeptide (TPR) repeat protein
MPHELTGRWASFRYRLALGHATHGRPEDALRHATAVVRRRHHPGDQGADLASAYEIVATCHQQLGQLEGAATARRSAVELLERIAPGTSACRLAQVKLGDLVRFQGDFNQAEQILNRALAGIPVGDNDPAGHPLRAVVLNALGIVYKDTGRYADAEAAYTESLALITATSGGDNPMSASIWHNLAGLAYARNHPEEAASAAARAVAIRERSFGRDHHLVAQDLAVHGVALLELGRTGEAEALFNRALTIFRSRHPADRYEVAVNLGNLAACRLNVEDAAGAEALMREALSIKQTIFGPDHPEIARQLNNLAVAVAAQDRIEEASDLHRQALSIARVALPDDHPLTAACRQNAATSERHQPTATAAR